MSASALAGRSPSRYACSVLSTFKAKWLVSSALLFGGARLWAGDDYAYPYALGMVSIMIGALVAFSLHLVQLDRTEQPSKLD